MSIAFRITLIIVSVFTLLYMCKKVKTGKITDRVFYFLDIVCDNARFV